MIGALAMSHPNFRFAGEIKGLKLGADLVASSADDDDEFADFADTPLKRSWGRRWPSTPS